MSDEIKLASVVDTPDARGDVAKVDGDLVEVTLNDAVEPEHAVEKTLPHGGWYRKEDCELVHH